MTDLDEILSDVATMERDARLAIETRNVLDFTYGGEHMNIYILTPERVLEWCAQTRELADEVRRMRTPIESVKETDHE
jgi:hypothetical protein